jgi:hypothetical protein
VVLCIVSKSNNHDIMLSMLPLDRLETVIGLGIILDAYIGLRPGWAFFECAFCKHKSFLLPHLFYFCYFKMFILFTSITTSSYYATGNQHPSSDHHLSLLPHHHNSHRVLLSAPPPINIPQPTRLSFPYLLVLLLLFYS